MSEEKSEAKQGFKLFKNWSFLKKIKQVKHIGLIITIIFILILLIILFGDFNFSFLTEKSSTDNSSISVNSTYTSSNDYSKLIEDKLKSLISKINGVGDVEVMISVNSGSRVLIASNDETTTTKNSKGEEITTVSANPIIIQQNGTSNPLVIGEVLPNITGVVIVCSGAKDVQVRLNILSAVKALLELDESNIVILVGK